MGLQIHLFINTTVRLSLSADQRTAQLIDSSNLSCDHHLSHMGRGRKRAAPVETHASESDEVDSPTACILAPRRCAWSCLAAHKASLLQGDEERATLFAKRAKSTGGRVSSFFQPQAAGTAKTLADFGLHHHTGDEERLLDIAAQLPERHPNEKAAARRRLEAQFGLWYLQWRCGRLGQ